MNRPKTCTNLPVCLFLLVLAACGRPEPGPEPTPVPSAAPVGFGVTLESRSKAGAMLTAADITSLGVFGYSTGQDDFSYLNASHTPNLAYNSELAKVAGAWEYVTPKVYWPVDLTVKNAFFAYAPHSTEFPPEANVQLSSPTSSNYPTLSYTVPEEAFLHTDVLYAAPALNRNADDGEILYEMKHALVWITVIIAPVKKVNDAESYTIKSLYCTGKNMTTRAMLNLGTGVWTGLASSTVEYRVLPLPAPAPAPPPVQVNHPAFVTGPGRYMMLLPQTISREVNEPTINVSYTYSPDGVNQEEDEYFYSVPFPETPTFSSGGRIVVFVLRISTEGVSVTFSENSITDWLQSGQDPDPVDVY